MVQRWYARVGPASVECLQHGRRPRFAGNRSARPAILDARPAAAFGSINAAIGLRCRKFRKRFAPERTARLTDANFDPSERRPLIRKRLAAGGSSVPNLRLYREPAACDRASTRSAGLSFGLPLR